MTNKLNGVPNIFIALFGLIPIVKLNGISQFRKCTVLNVVQKCMLFMVLDNVVTQHTTACCSVQVVDIILTEGPFRKYYILQSSTTET